jgi:hypothetical protein
LIGRQSQDVRVFEQDSTIVEIVTEGVPIGIEPVTHLDNQSTIDERLHRIRRVPLGNLGRRYGRVARDMTQDLDCLRIQLAEVRIKETLNVESIRK